MNIKVWFGFWTFISVTLNSFVFRIGSFSPSNINIDVDAEISVCHFTKITEPTPAIFGICEFKGESCSIAAYFNHSQPQFQKEVKCDCWDVFSDTDQAIIPGKEFNTFGDILFILLEMEMLTYIYDFNSII